MLSVDDALGLILQHAGQQDVVPAPLEEAGGLVLAEAVTSDIDSPPFTKALVDGYAVRAADLADGRADLDVIEEVPAGHVPTRRVEPGTACRIMTGAPLPSGADAVVMREICREYREEGRVEIAGRVDPGANLMAKGRELRKGQVVLQAGHLLGAPEIGLLATVGCVRPKVYRRPTAAILATGTEIVHPDTKPGPGQIRNSNQFTLHCLALRAGAVPHPLGVVPDDRKKLRAQIAEGLKDDVLLLTGGVSAGATDLVPTVLEELGVKCVFHKVEMKPGKPLWFGTHDRGLVFGLPGNPVSVLCCFEVFVRSALRARQRWEQPLPQFVMARLVDDFAYPTDRITYHPARLIRSRGEAEAPVVTPLPWFGSPDLCAVTAANGLLVCPITDAPHRAGTTLPVLLIDRV